jgi:hypothetical protein
MSIQLELQPYASQNQVEDHPAIKGFIS